MSDEVSSPGVISGVVRTAQGTPVDMARVLYTSAPVPMADIAALTGEDGAFSLDAPADGAYRVKVAAEGYRPAELQCTVRERESEQLVIILEGEA